MRVTTSNQKIPSPFTSQNPIRMPKEKYFYHIKKLGTLAELSERLGTNRDGVMAWAKERQESKRKNIKKKRKMQLLRFPSIQTGLWTITGKNFLPGGYLFLQTVYYGLKMDSICRKIRYRYKFKYDLNAILSDLIYTRVLEPSSKTSSFKVAQQFLETPTYELHDVYRALSVLAKESDFIQAEVYKNSSSWETETIKYFIMIVQTTISRSSRKIVIKSMERAKNTGRILSFRWDCLPMEMGFH